MFNWCLFWIDDYVQCSIDLQGKYEVPLIVMEYMEQGDLFQYLRNNQKIQGDTMVKFAYGICLGMEYLHEEGVVHKDLAARNCLIDSDNQIKIGDFGKFDDYYGEDYHQKQEVRIHIESRIRTIT